MTWSEKVVGARYKSRNNEEKLLTDIPIPTNRVDVYWSGLFITTTFAKFFPLGEHGVNDSATKLIEIAI